MFNWFAKILLTATSLSPLLGAVAVAQFEHGKSWVSWGSWLLVAVLLALICGLLLTHSGKTSEKENILIKEFERNDKEVVAFLIAYLLPFISAENMNFEGHWLVGSYVLFVIFIVVSHAGTFHFNPVMGLLGYHFYEVKSEEGISQLLISKEELRKPGIEVEVVKLAQGIYLHTGVGGA